MATDLLSLPLKGTSSADLEQGLLLFISTSYSHEQAEELRGAVCEVHALRERVRALTLSEATVEETVGSLGRYAKLITSMSSRFGTAIDDVLSGTDAQLELTWSDAHRPEAKCTLHQLGFERACALYNLGAALSYRATTRNTADADGLRAACQDLQQAAGALEAAGGAVAGAPWSSDRRLTADVSAAALEGKRALMLAQAQRCFYDRAKRDQMKGGVVAKLAAAIAAFYDEAAAKLRSVRDMCAAGGGGEVSPPDKERGGGMLAKTKERAGRAVTAAPPAPLLALVCVAEAGARMFDAWAQWHSAAEHEERHEYGPQVARLQRAVELAAEAMARLAAGGAAAGGSGGAAGAAAVPAEVSRACAEAEATIQASEATASKHNTHVYHERVPPISTLPAPLPKPIVKATPPAALAPPGDVSGDASRASGDVSGDASQGDPFVRLVPLTVLTDASVYTASLDDVLRRMSDRLQDIEQTTAGELASMDLPDALDAVKTDSRIPPSLAEAIARAQTAGGTASLSDMLSSVAQKTADLDSLAMSIEALLEVEEGADQQLHTQHRERWACVRSAALTADARRELAEIRTDISQADAANAALRSHHASCLEQLQLLNFSMAELNAMVPRGEEGATLADLECVADIRTLLESLRSCAAARAAALADARALASRDDVTSELVYRGDAAGGSTEAVFSKALARYEPFASRIRESADLEAELLSALRTANDDFTAARTSDPSQPQREAFFHRIGLAVKAFDDIEAQLLHGLDYCAAAADRLEALQSTVTSLGAARAYERTELLEALHEETANEEARAAAAEALAEARAQQQQYPPPPPAVARGFAPAVPPAPAPPTVPLAAGYAPPPVTQLGGAPSWEPPAPAAAERLRVGWADGDRSKVGKAPAPPPHPPPPAVPPPAPPPPAAWAGGVATAACGSASAPPWGPDGAAVGRGDSDDAQLQAALRASLRDLPPQPAAHTPHSYAPPFAAPPQLSAPPVPPMPIPGGAVAPYAPAPPRHSSAFPPPPPAGPSAAGMWPPAPPPQHAPSPAQYAPPPPVQYAPPPPRQYAPPQPPPRPPPSGTLGPPPHDADLAWAMAESLKLAGAAAPPPRVQYSPPPPAAPPPAAVSSQPFFSAPSPPCAPPMAPPAYLAAPTPIMVTSIPEYRHPPPPARISSGASPAPAEAQNSQAGLTNGAPPVRALALPAPTPFGAPPAFDAAAAPAHAASFAPLYAAPPPPGGVPAIGYAPPPGAGSFPPPPGGTSYAMPPPPGAFGSSPPPPPFNAVAPPPAGVPMGMGAAGKVAPPSYVPRW